MNYSRPLFNKYAADSRVDYSKLDARIDAKVLKDNYSEIKQIADTSLNKSDRRKIRKDLILKMFNELYDIEPLENYSRLEAYLTLSKDARLFVKDLKSAIAALTTMMSDYVTSGISFDSWQAICVGRDTARIHFKTKSQDIKIAADVFKAKQVEWIEKDEAMLTGLSVPARIDLLNQEALPDDVKRELSQYNSDSSVLADKTKVALSKFKAEELKKFQVSPSTYELPESK